MTGITNETPHLVVEKRDGVAYVTLNDPEKRNAFSPEMIVRLCDAWEDIRQDPHTRVVLLTGAGDKAFSSGGDMGTTIPLMMRTRPPAGEWEQRFAANRKQPGAAILRETSFFKPIVAAINGHAHAGGAEFLLSTDIRVMSSEATIALTEVRRGLIAAGGSLARLTRLRVSSGVNVSPVTWTWEGRQFVTVLAGLGGAAAGLVSRVGGGVPRGGAVWTFALPE